MRARSILFTLAILFTATACNDISGPADIDLTGTWILNSSVTGWAGTCTRQSELHLVQKGEQQLTGFRGTGVCGTYPLVTFVPLRTGVRQAENVLLIDDECRFEGKLISDALIEGVVICNHYDKPAGTWRAQRVSA